MKKVLLMLSLLIIAMLSFGCIQSEVPEEEPAVVDEAAEASLAQLSDDQLLNLATTEDFGSFVGLATKSAIKSKAAAKTALAAKLSRASYPSRLACTTNNDCPTGLGCSSSTRRCTVELACSDYLDNDNDGKVDCDDMADCFRTVYCEDYYMSTLKSDMPTDAGGSSDGTGSDSGLPTSGEGQLGNDIPVQGLSADRPSLSSDVADRDYPQGYYSGAAPAETLAQVLGNRDDSPDSSGSSSGTPTSPGSKDPNDPNAGPEAEDKTGETSGVLGYRQGLPTSGTSGPGDINNGAGVGSPVAEESTSGDGTTAASCDPSCSNLGGCRDGGDGVHGEAQGFMWIWNGRRCVQTACYVSCSWNVASSSWTQDNS